MVLKVVNGINHRILAERYSRKDCHVSEQILVFESDDWGSIRMSNREDWNDLKRMGYHVDERPYERYDTLESAEDVYELCQVLYKYKDRKEHHPVITANMLMANPDFEKIKRSSYRKYYYEPISETYKRYFGSLSVVEEMKDGFRKGVFKPQSHGREHFNIHQWMQKLQSGDENTLVAFSHNMCGIAPKETKGGNTLMNALKGTDAATQQDIENIVREGLHQFSDFWGMQSKTFVAPCYAWNQGVESVLADEGVDLIQCSRVSKAVYQQPATYHYSGERNKLGQVYSIRNCTFEPATTKNYSIEQTLSQIESAFKNHKVAVVSTHRINFAGGLSKENRVNNLRYLDVLLREVLSRFTNVCFKSSDELIEIYK